MRQEIITKTYLKFEELSEKQQSKVLDKLRDINIDHEWYDSIYEDAKNIGAKISGFDLGRGNDIDFKFVLNAELVAKAIIENHGKICDTYKLAKAFKKDVKKMSEESEEYDDLVRAFEKDIGEEFLSMLKKDFEYYQTDESVKETILANDYEFDSETLDIV